MKKLLNKKGFTLVELIVVIAIMGIMLAIVIPMLSTSDARKDEVKEYARSFYSNVQELMIDEKLAKTPFPEADTTKFLLVCAEVDRDKTTYDDVLIYMSHGVDVVSLSSPLPLTDTTNNDDRLVLDKDNIYKGYEEFGNSLRRLLLGNERSGYYFAIVDAKYRVVSTYFISALDTDADFDTVYTELKANTTKFTDEATIGSRYAGAYPVELCDKDKKMFELP